MFVATLTLILALSSSAIPPYDGPWRAACDDPTRLSGLLVGPPGPVILQRVLRGTRVRLSDGHGSWVFTIAGITPTKGTHRALETLLRGRRIEVFGAITPKPKEMTQRALDSLLRDRRIEVFGAQSKDWLRRPRKGILMADGQDVVLLLLLSGAGRFQRADLPANLDSCYYESAEIAARDARVGVWKTLK